MEKDEVIVEGVVPCATTVACILKQMAVEINKKLYVVIDQCCIDSVEIKTNVKALITGNIERIQQMAEQLYLESVMQAQFTITGTDILRRAKDDVIQFMIDILAQNEEEEEEGAIPENKVDSDIEEEKVTPSLKLGTTLPLIGEVLNDSIVATFMTKERKEIAQNLLNLNFTSNLRQQCIVELISSIEQYMLLINEIEKRVKK